MNERDGIYEEVTPMSSIAAPHDFRFSRTAQTPSLRLTRRGRLTVLVLFVALALLAIGALGGQSAATDEPGTPVQTRTVVVGAGDTLWEIASEVAEPGEVREMIHHIQELNALPSAGLQAGQELAVPVG